MEGRDERIYEEAAALWRELHHDGSPLPSDAGMILDLITGTLPDLAYERLCSPWLRASNITWPRPPKTD